MFEKKIIKYVKRNDKKIIICKTCDLIRIKIETKIITINNLQFNTFLQVFRKNIKFNSDKKLIYYKFKKTKKFE